MRTTHRAPIACLVLVTGLLGGGAALLAEDAPVAYAGMSLAEALRDLQSRGLKIFFTSKLVGPELRVVEEPAATDPRRVLDEILAPHGLTTEPGPGGRLVIVAGEPVPAGIRGLARERESAEPIPGVRILITGTGLETYTDHSGGFHFADVPAGSQTVEAHLPGFVVRRREVSLPPGQVVEVDFELDSAPLAVDEIVVTPSRVSLLREEPVTGLDFDRGDILALPHFGDDVFRAVTLLPGATGDEVSARFSVRGGRADEVLVLLDQAELFEPYHLKDYNSRVSIVAPRALREVNLITGGFPAQYGDRMSGVLDMSTVEPSRRRNHFGLSILSSEIGGSGPFLSRRGHWLAVARRSNLEVALDLLDIRENPKYWDAFGKIEIRPRPEQRFGVHLLHADDSLDFFKLDAGVDTEDLLTSYGNTYLWLTHQAILGPRFYVDSAVSAGRVERDRRGVETELGEEHDGEFFTLIDRRRLDVAGLKQDWSLRAGDRQYLRWGLEVRRLKTAYDYFNERELEDPLAAVRAVPRTGTTVFLRNLIGEQWSAYLSDRLRPMEALTLELGLRYDEHTLTEDRNVSPRLNLVWSPDRRTALRLAWGYFFQSQRPYELQVEDGVTELVRAERTEQLVIGFEHVFDAGADELLLRVEAYRRDITDPRPRYENLFEPIEVFPEIELDRVLFAPGQSEARGLEVFVRGGHARVDWWASYTRSEITDHIDGRDVPRRFDQPHAFSFDLNFRAGKHWNLNLAWRYHTGWPTTAISGAVEEDDEGEIEVVPVVGPFHAERLPPYHRMDLRASREWKKNKGVLGFFLEIQNLYNRENIAGFDINEFQFEIRPDGEIDVTPAEETWDGFLPSFGITWEF